MKVSVEVAGKRKQRHTLANRQRVARKQGKKRCTFPSFNHASHRFESQARAAAAAAAAALPAKKRLFVWQKQKAAQKKLYQFKINVEVDVVKRSPNYIVREAHLNCS